MDTKLVAVLLISVVAIVLVWNFQNPSLNNNLIENGGFEDGSIEWVGWNGINVVSDESANGIKSAYFPEEHGSLTSEAISVTPNKAHYFGCKFKLAKKTTYGMMLEFVLYSSSHEIYIHYHSATATVTSNGAVVYNRSIGNGWREVLVKFFTQKNSYQATCYKEPQGGSPMYIDDVYLGVEPP